MRKQTRKVIEFAMLADDSVKPELRDLIMRMTYIKKLRNKKAVKKNIKDKE